MTDDNRPKNEELLAVDDECGESGEILTLTDDEDGKEKEFLVIDRMDVENKTYVLLHPEDGEEDEVVIYEELINDSYRPLDDEELDRVIIAFQESGDYEIINPEED